MALTITVTKGPVVNMGGNVYLVTSRLNCVDGAATVVDEDVTVTVMADPSQALAIAKTEIAARMQAIIDTHNSGSPALPDEDLDTVVSDVSMKLSQNQAAFQTMQAAKVGQQKVN